MKMHEFKEAPPREVYSVPDAAAALSVGLVTIYRLLKDGTLRRCKLGRRTLIPAADISALVERMAQGGKVA